MTLLSLMSAIISCISNIMKMTLLSLMSVLTSLTTHQIFLGGMEEISGGGNPRVPPVLTPDGGDGGNPVPLLPQLPFYLKGTM